MEKCRPEEGGWQNLWGLGLQGAWAMKANYTERGGNWASRTYTDQSNKVLLGHWRRHWISGILNLEFSIIRGTCWHGVYYFVLPVTLLVNCVAETCYARMGDNYLSDTPWQQGKGRLSPQGIISPPIKFKEPESEGVTEWRVPFSTEFHPWQADVRNNSGGKKGFLSTNKETTSGIIFIAPYQKWISIWKRTINRVDNDLIPAGLFFPLQVIW